MTNYVSIRPLGLPVVQLLQQRQGPFPGKASADKMCTLNAI